MINYYMYMYLSLPPSLPPSPSFPLSLSLPPSLPPSPFLPPSLPLPPFRRLAENEKQNKELLLVTSKKEELIQQLQFKEEQYIEEIASLNRQLDNSRSDTRRQIEDLKDRNESKERSSLVRVADLEAQLGRVNAQLTQVQKTKDEVKEILK